MTLETDNTNPVKTTKPRRWFRFRLRTLLIMVMVLSVPLGWVGWEMDQRRREKATIAWVMEMGGGVYLLSEVESDQRDWWGKTKDKWFGESEQVSFVGLNGTQVRDLSPLAELNNLASLHLFATQVSDLSPLAELNNLGLLDLEATQVNNVSSLAELKNLEWLDLKGTNVSDLSPLMGLKNLKQLCLHDTPVSDEQVQELRLALPNCKISF